MTNETNRINDEATELKEIMDADKVKIVEEKPIGKRLVITRESFGDDKEKELFSYFVEGEVNGRIFKATVVPVLKKTGEDRTENGYNSYQALDLIYILSKEVYLESRPYSFTTKDGEVIEGSNLYIVGEDKTGMTMDVQVKAQGRGDETLLTLMLKGFGGIEDKNRFKIVDHSEKQAETVIKSRGGTEIKDGTLPF